MQAAQSGSEEEEDEETRPRDAQLAISSSDEEDDDEEGMFPLEGKYKDEADKARLMAMSQLEREEELASRAEVIAREQQDRSLKALLKHRKERKPASFDIAESTRRSTRTGVLPKSKDATKAGQLADIRKSREEKGSGKKAELTDRAVEAKKLVEVLELEVEEREITVEDLNKCKIGRSGFHKLVDYPGFEEAVQGSFVRVSLWDSVRKTNTYRIAQIKSFSTGKVYDVMNDNRKTDQYLQLVQGKAERQFPMNMMSDGKFTESEFRRYKAQMEFDKVPLPKLSFLEKKKHDLRRLDAYVLKPDEIDALITRRNRFKINVFELNLERASLVQKIKTLQAKGALYDNSDEIAKAEERIQEIDSIKERNRGNTHTKEMENQERLAELNEKNRKRNRIEIRQAELAERAVRRQAALDPNAPQNPFLRVKTKVRTMYNIEDDNAKAKEKAAEKAEGDAKEDDTKMPTAKEVLEKAKEEQKGPLLNISKAATSGDSLIASLDLGIDDDLGFDDDM
ncbi:plus-3-domain-containing protein [Ascobolus immersus RN42]|uniref:Plus-3-domain-containing protein n=1 Tax=Ascobolus immersus RN42 TaxID=1160509 RepID=A0A3N4IUK3_ASCIM|nr:plus-3-domain-containing protein [Ascobolus immersus RN42]